MHPCQEKASILRNARLQGSYWRLDVGAAAIARAVAPGQFVHVRVPGMAHRILRRPFSVCDAEVQAGTLSIVYKIVGEGTAHLAELAPGVELDLLGPLGNGYSEPASGDQPIIVAGGYGCAATYLFARRSPVPPVVLLGGRTAEDILLLHEFRALGCNVRLSTDDGSLGHPGLVTEMLAGALAETAHPFVVACGPNPMLRAVSRIVVSRGLDAEVSLDHVMCCGVGACFACVVKMKAENAEGWEYVRTCKVGPVFRAGRICWEDGDAAP